MSSYVEKRCFRFMSQYDDIRIVFASVDRDVEEETKDLVMNFRPPSSGAGAQKTLRLNIVNRGEWLGSPANIKGANKDAKIYVGRSATLHNLLFSYHTLCMNYVANPFLLVSSSVPSKQLLCFVHGEG